MLLRKSVHGLLKLGTRAGAHAGWTHSNPRLNPAKSLTARPNNRPTARRAAILFHSHSSLIKPPAPALAGCLAIYLLLLLVRLCSPCTAGWPSKGGGVVLWGQAACDTKVDRARARTHQQRKGSLSNPEYVTKIAALINALVDMEYWTEDEEQIFFEDAVRGVLEVLEEMLPSPMLHLVINSDVDDGIEEEYAESLRSRMVEYVKWKLKLPYLISRCDVQFATSSVGILDAQISQLTGGNGRDCVISEDETDEIRVISAVCAVIVESLKRGNSFSNVVDPVHSGELIIDVFVKGAVGMLDENNKKEFITDICEGIEIPFLPEFIKRWVADKIISEIASRFEQVLLYTFQRHIGEAYDWAAERVQAARESDEFRVFSHQKPYKRGLFWGHRTNTPAEFAKESPVLRKGRLWVDEALILPTFESGAFAAEVRERLVNDLNERIDIIGWVCNKFEEWEGLAIQKVIDLTLFESVDLVKMEGSVLYLSRENFAYALGYEWFECIKEQQLPFPPSWRQNEWYWALAKELAKRDMTRISEKDQSEEKDRNIQFSE